MIFQSFLLDVNESNAYLVACELTREAILVDAGDFDLRIKEFIDQKALNLTTVFITHDHYDHTSGLSQIIKTYGPTVLSGSGHAGSISGKRTAHGQEIKIGHLTATVLATPGHTPESLSLATHGLVFTGDALFSGSVGGTSTPENASQQIESLRQHILTLPADYEIHPGHGPASTVGIERQFNPFLAA